MTDDFDEMLAEWQRFSNNSQGMTRQEQVQFILTYLGKDGVRSLNEFMEKMNKNEEEP